LFLFFLDNLADVLAFLTLQDKKIYVHCRKISN